MNYTGLIGIVYLTPLESLLTRRYFMRWDTCSARHLVQLKVSLATYASYPEMIADFSNCIWWAIDDVNWCLFEISDFLVITGRNWWLLVTIGGCWCFSSFHVIENKLYPPTCSLTSGKSWESIGMCFFLNKPTWSIHLVNTLGADWTH